MKKRTKTNRSVGKLNPVPNKQECETPNVLKKDEENCPASSSTVDANCASTSSLGREKTEGEEKNKKELKTVYISNESYNLILQNIIQNKKKKESETKKIQRCPERNKRVVIITNENVMWGLQKSILETTSEKLSLIPNSDLSKGNLLKSIADEL